MFEENLITLIDSLFFREDGVFAYLTASVAVLILLLLIRRFTKVRMDDGFFFSLIPFILFGAAVRVSVDAGLLPYTSYTTVPGVYIVVGVFTFLLILLLARAKRMALLPYFGTALFAYQFLFLAGSLRNPSYGYLVLLIAVAGMMVSLMLMRLLGTKSTSFDQAFIFSHILDGSATYVAVELFHAPGLSYMEMQPATLFLARLFGTMAYYPVMKLLFAIGLVAVLERYALFAPLFRLPKRILREDMNIIVFVLLMIGLGPGFRNLLRVVCGV